MAQAQQQTDTELGTITVTGEAITQTGPEETEAEAGENARGPVDGYNAQRSATGIKTDTPLKEIPQSVSVVGREQMEDQGAQTLQEAVRYVPGVVADGYGLDSRTDSTFVRGTAPTKYLDGLRRTFDYYIYNYRIDPYFMERIEVLKGPASVLYGQAAVGGIINSVSKRPRREKSGEVTAEYGTFDFKQTRFDFTGPVSADGRWSYRLTGLVRGAETQVDHVDDDRFAVQPALTFRPTADTNITLLGHFRKDRTGSTQQFLPHEGTIFPSASGIIPWDTFVGEPDDKYDTDVASGTLMVEHRFNETFKLRHNTRYADIHNEYNSSYPGFFAGAPTYVNAAQTEMYRVKQVGTADTRIFNSDTNLEAKFDTGAVGHKLLGGFNYADFSAESAIGTALNQTPFNVYDPVYGQPENLVANLCDGTGPVPVAEVPVCDQSQDLTQSGLYLQDQMRLGNWIAVLGARHDWVENTSASSSTQEDEATTYRAGLMYELPVGLTPYVSYAESFEPLVGTAFDGSTFDPKEGVMYEAGFKYQPADANFAINGAVYDIAESNRLASDPAHPNFSVQTGEVGIRGFEIEGRGNVTPDLKLIASYSYTDAEYTGGDQKGFQVASVPKHLASFWAVREFSLFGRDGFSVGGGVRHVGASWDGTDSLETPSYTLFDAMLAYETEDWRLQVTGTNLEDEEYLTTCLSRGDCFRGTSRTVIAGITRKF